MPFIFSKSSVNQSGIIFKINNTFNQAYIFYNIESMALLIMEFSIMLCFKATLTNLSHHVRTQSYAYKAWDFGTALEKHIISKKFFI